MLNYVKYGVALSIYNVILLVFTYLMLVFVLWENLEKKKDSNFLKSSEPHERLL